MEDILIFSGIGAGVCSLICLLAMTIRLLSHGMVLFGFSKHTHIGKAVVIGFTGRHSQYRQLSLSPDVVIRYYNEFQHRDIETRVMGINEKYMKKTAADNVKLGDQLQIEYTMFRARITDAAYIKSDQYKLSKYIWPIVASISGILLGCGLCVAGIIIG